MCGRKAKRDPRIDEEQEKARQAAEAAKEQAEAKKEAELLLITIWGKQIGKLSWECLFNKESLLQQVCEG